MESNVGRIKHRMAFLLHVVEVVDILRVARNETSEPRAAEQAVRCPRQPRLIRCAACVAPTDASNLTAQSIRYECDRGWNGFRFVYAGLAHYLADSSLGSYENMRMHASGFSS